MANAGAGIGGGLSGAASGAVVGGPIGAAVGGLGGLLGGLFGSGSDNSAEYIQDALNQYNNINAPTDLSDPLQLQQYLKGGTLTPELLQKLNLNADKATTLVENPADRANQQAALNALKQLSQSGMSATDLAQLNASRQSVAQDTQAKIQSLLQQQQMRGQSDSGSTLAAQLSAIQNGNTQQSNDAMNAAAQAESARNQALQNYANLSGQIRGQDYNTQQFNTENDIQRQRFLDQNSLSRQSTNTSANNNAQLFNLNRAQNVSDSNTGMYNQELARQKQAEEQEYQNALALAQSKANAYTQQAANSSAQAANSAQNFGNIMNGVGQLAVGGAKSGLWGNLFPSSNSSNTYQNSYASPTGNSSSTSQFGGLGGNYSF